MTKEKTRNKIPEEPKDPTSESSILTLKDLEKDVLHNRLKFYLKKYFVKPLPLEDPIIEEADKWLASPPSEKTGYYSLKENDFFCFLQSVILGYNRKIDWGEISIPVLIQETFSEYGYEDRIDYYNQELVIIWEIPNSVPNIRKWEVVLQLWEIRALKNKKTLLLSTVSSIGTSEINLVPFSSIGQTAIKEII